MIGVGVIGTGALGGVIAQRLAEQPIPGIRLAAIAGRLRSRDRLEAQAREWRCDFTTNPLELPLAGASLIVEAAGVEAAKDYALPLVRAGCDIVLMSSGAMADPAFAEALRQAAGTHGRHIYLPSGSIAGLDGLLSSMEGDVRSVRITTRKHPDALVGAPQLEGGSSDLSAICEERVIFEGNARQAIAGFPANLNVAATLAAAIGDLDRVSVRIIADPAASQTSHTVEVEAASGRMTVSMLNRPSPRNPRSSWLAALSALATIRKIASVLQIG